MGMCRSCEPIVIYCGDGMATQVIRKQVAGERSVRLLRLYFLLKRAVVERDRRIVAGFRGGAGDRHIAELEVEDIDRRLIATGLKADQVHVRDGMMRGR